MARRLRERHLTVRIRNRLRHLEQAAAERLITIELEDGTVARFTPDVWEEVFVHEWERWGKDHDGEDPGPAHPVVEALRKAKDLKELMREHGTMLGFSSERRRLSVARWKGQARRSSGTRGGRCASSGDEALPDGSPRRSDQ